MRTPERVELTDTGPARLVLVKIVLRRADAKVLGPGKNGLSAARRKVGRSIGFERSQGRALGQFSRRALERRIVTGQANTDVP